MLKSIAEMNFKSLKNMSHKCYISFKTEDEDYKSEIQKMKEAGELDYIDKSLNDPIDSDDPDYIMRKIREDYLSDFLANVNVRITA